MNQIKTVVRLIHPQQLIKEVEIDMTEVKWISFVTAPEMQSATGILFNSSEVLVFRHRVEFVNPPIQASIANIVSDQHFIELTFDYSQSKILALIPKKPIFENWAVGDLIYWTLNPFSITLSYD